MMKTVCRESGEGCGRVEDLTWGAAGFLAKLPHRGTPDAFHPFMTENVQFPVRHCLRAPFYSAKLQSPQETDTDWSADWLSGQLKYQ